MTDDVREQLRLLGKPFAVPTDLAGHQTYGRFQPRDWALLWIEKYGGIAGDHHKAWVLDQVARILHGAPVTLLAIHRSGSAEELIFQVGTSPEYEAWVERMRGEKGEDGSYEYDYDCGVAP